MDKKTATDDLVSGVETKRELRRLAKTPNTINPLTESFDWDLTAEAVAGSEASSTTVTASLPPPEVVAQGFSKKGLVRGVDFNDIPPKTDFFEDSVARRKLVGELFSLGYIRRIM